MVQYISTDFPLNLLDPIFKIVKVLKHDFILFKFVWLESNLSLIYSFDGFSSPTFNIIHILSLVLHHRVKHLNFIF